MDVSWEIERHDWTALCAQGEKVRDVLIQMSQSSDFAETFRLEGRLEDYVAPGGIIYPGAPEAISSIVQVLPSIHPDVQISALEFLAFVASFAIQESCADPLIVSAATKPLLEAVPVAAQLAQDAPEATAVTAADVLECVRELPGADRQRIDYVLARFRERGFTWHD